MAPQAPRRRLVGTAGEHAVAPRPDDQAHHIIDRVARDPHVDAHANRIHERDGDAQPRRADGSHDDEMITRDFDRGTRVDEARAKGNMV